MPCDAAAEPLHTVAVSDAQPQSTRPPVDAATWFPEVTRLVRPDVEWGYQQWVTTTPKPNDTATPIDVLVVCLDAPWTFGTVVDVMRLRGLGKELPAGAVVGIAHDTDNLREVVNLRAVDYTVSEYVPPPQIGVRLAAHEVGKAEQFRHWLASAVLPSLRERFAPSHVTFVGHSFSALFGLHVLFSQPDLFDSYLLASPSVWWDDRVMFDTEAAHAARTTELAARVFMSRGGEEVGDWSPFDEFFDQVRSRNYEGLELHVRALDDEFHNSVVPTAVATGLRTLLAFPREQWPSERTPSPSASSQRMA